MINLPESFLNKIQNMLGKEYDSFLESYSKSPLQGLRLNRTKVSPKEWEGLSVVKMKPVPWIDNGYYFDGNIFAATRHPYYYAGLYYIQEPSAQTPANILAVNPGDRVLDLCAAPGGKSTELAAKLNGKGVLVSNDISVTRAKALIKNLGVFGIKHALITSDTPQNLSAVFKGYFNKILVDAPCSGEGMFRKEPAIIKNWEQYGTGYYNDLQKDILPNAVNMLSDDGYLLYSTCTFSPDENEGTIDYILTMFPELEVIPVNDSYEGFDSGHPEWIGSDKEEIRGAVRIWPHKMEGEGHFLCLLHKKKADYPKHFETNVKRVKLSNEEEAFLKSWGLTNEELARLELHGEKLYLIPEGLPDVTGLRILRNGLYVGDRKKGRFEPSEPFAMSRTKDEARYFLDLDADDERVVRYLKCETIEVTKDELVKNKLDKAEKGAFILIGINGFPLGFGKLSGTTVKNKYFAGWRMM